LSERWATLVIEAVAEGPMHHSDLRRALPGVTQKMLTRTLRGLERDGLVRRILHHTRPVGVSYSLTPLGQELFLLQRQLYTWAVDHASVIQQAQAAFDAEVLDGRRPSVLDLNRGHPLESAHQARSRPA
jgi:DNA-binding HxlR family transcriptional regulator